MDGAEELGSSARFGGRWRFFCLIRQATAKKPRESAGLPGSRWTLCARRPLRRHQDRRPRLHRPIRQRSPRAPFPSSMKSVTSGEFLVNGLHSMTYSGSSVCLVLLAIWSAGGERFHHAAHASTSGRIPELGWLSGPPFFPRLAEILELPAKADFAKVRLRDAKNQARRLFRWTAAYHTRGRSRLAASWISNAQ